jgi:hypothetical protein
MSFRFSPLAAALGLALGYRGLPAQVTAEVATPAPTGRAIPASLALTDSPEPTPPHARAALKTAYRLRLTSTWPQETAGGCRNGGEETVAGALELQADGSYAGTLTRHTTLLFCGAHGPGAAACSLALTGTGPVTMTGLVLADDRSPSGRALRVTWSPARGHQAEVTGACADNFKTAVQEMYLSTPHAAEFPVTTVGSGPTTEELDSYAWKVELQ